MAHEHSSGLPAAYARAPANPSWTGVIAREDRIAQAAEINEVQTILGRRVQRVGDLVARDGDRIEGADVVVDVEAGTVILDVNLDHVVVPGEGHDNVRGPRMLDGVDQELPDCLVEQGGRVLVERLLQPVVVDLEAHVVALALLVHEPLDGGYEPGLGDEG